MRLRPETLSRRGVHVRIAAGGGRGPGAGHHGRRWQRYETARAVVPGARGVITAIVGTPRQIQLGAKVVF
jgi:hypothetical protein